MFKKTPLTKKIFIAADTPIGTLDDGFFNLGYDEILSTYRNFGEESLKLLKQLVPKFKYVRIHNMFTGEKGDRKGKINAGCNPVYRGKNGILEFEWEKIDRVYDVLVNLGYVPYIEFGFMPPALSSAQGKTNILGKSKLECRYPPKDYDEWRTLIRELLKHFVDRYGKDEVSKKWCFELWNEPNSPTFWRGSKKEFFKLYDYTVEGMLDVFPKGNFKIGGPALSSTSYKFMRKFIEHCLWEKNQANGEAGTKLDFLSFHVKGGWAWQTPNMKRLTRLILSYHAVAKFYAKNTFNLKGKENIKLLPEDFEIQITELDPVVGCDLGVEVNEKFNFRNTDYYTSFIGYTATLMFWIKQKYGLNITEIFSDNIHFADEAGMVFKGTRNLTTAFFSNCEREKALDESNIFTKPVIKGYQCLNRLHPTVLKSERIEKSKVPVYDPVNLLATKKGKSIRILVNHYQGDYDSEKHAEIKLYLRELESFSEAQIKIYRFDQKGTNTNLQWKEWGSPGSIEQKKWELLKEIEKNFVPVSKSREVVKNGELSILLKLGANKTVYIEIHLKL